MRMATPRHIGANTRDSRRRVEDIGRKMKNYFVGGVATTWNVIPVVRFLSSHESETIGSREKYFCVLAYSRIILMIVAAGSGWILGSHSVAMREVVIVSFFTENPLSLTFSSSAAALN